MLRHQIRHFFKLAQIHFSREFTFWGKYGNYVARLLAWIGNVGFGWRNFAVGFLIESEFTKFQIFVSWLVLTTIWAFPYFFRLSGYLYFNLTIISLGYFIWELHFGSHFDHNYYFDYYFEIKQLPITVKKLVIIKIFSLLSLLYFLFKFLRYLSQVFNHPFFLGSCFLTIFLFLSVFMILSYVFKLKIQ